jgi:hypothetical protein
VLARRAALATAVVASVLATSGSAAAIDEPSGLARSASGYPAVSRPPIKQLGPLPTMDGSVPLDPAPLSARSTTAATAAAAVASTTKAQVRALVVAVDADDWGVATWTATLDRVGAGHDVLHTRTTPLTSDLLVRPDGVGRYNAILLTNNNLLYQDASGALVSGLSADQWNLLWAYERDYRVRQATLYTSYGTWPEDYCLRAGSEGGVGDIPLTATLTTDGAPTFDYLNAAAQIPILQSYVYRDQLEPGCGGQPVLTAGPGGDVLGVRTTSADGRERLALTFTSNQYLLQAHLLAYGLFRWASRGLFFGEQRHYLNVDVDDWFNASDHLYPDGTIETDPGYQVSGHDAYNLHLQQVSLRASHPLAAGFTFGLAYNGGDADLSAGTTCYPDGGIDELTSTSRCLRDDFRWINHTLTHPKMNFTDYGTSRREIAENLDVASLLGLSVDGTVLKTGEYSGLGVYHPDPNNDIDPPTDYGLGASNPDLLRAAKDLGVKYLHGNMSFASHRPSCFNCGVVHPLEPALTIVPDWPTNIAYFCTTPDEETYFYNWYYGPNGKFPYWPENQTYAQVVEHETDEALNHLATGSIYTHTMHISNVHDYGDGRTLATDWADGLMAKYGSYYSVPLLSPTWTALAAYTTSRNEHFAELGAGVSAVYDSAANTVTVTSPAAGSVRVSGARTTGFTTYGSEVSAQITLAANTPVTFTPSLLP